MGGELCLAVARELTTVPLRTDELETKLPCCAMRASAWISSKVNGPLGRPNFPQGCGARSELRRHAEDAGSAKAG